MAVRDTLNEKKRNKLLEVLSADYRAENIFFALVSTIAMAFSIMILSDIMVIREGIPIIGSYPKVFAGILLAISILGLLLVIWPFYEPAIGEFKKISWATGVQMLEDVIRVLVYMVFFIFVLFFFDVICREIYALVY